MNDLERLAIQYQALEDVDQTDFQRAARVLQSMWRVEQRYPIGEHRGRPLGSRLAMPWAEQTLANFLNERVRQVVRQEVMDPRKAKGRLYARPRIYNDLLSSQPLCFNLFAELHLDLKLATAVLKDLSSGRVEQVTGIEFEYSPGRGCAQYTGDNSAFDVFVTFETPARQAGFAGIEVKYHENLADKPAPHRERYDAVAGLMGCFRPEALPGLRERPLQQIWRDHLLAGSLRHTDGYADGFFAFLYPKDNPACANAVRAYRSCLSDAGTFVAWTLEEVSEAIRRHAGPGWIDCFVDRYLNFARLSKCFAAGIGPTSGRSVMEESHG